MRTGVDKDGGVFVSLRRGTRKYNILYKQSAWEFREGDVKFNTSMLVFFYYIEVRTTCIYITLSFALINQQAISGSCRTSPNE